MSPRGLIALSRMVRACAVLNACLMAFEHFHLLVRVGIADRKFYHKAVELRFGQRLRTRGWFHFDENDLPRPW